MTARHPKRILFARAADASNLNAQAKNVQHILRHWQSTEVRPSVFAFSEPDRAVAANPKVDIIPIRPGRFWRAAVWSHYQRGFDAVFCPGIHHVADWLALRTRAAMGRPLTIIATAEGLISTGRDDQRERDYALVAGHPTYGQVLPTRRVRRIEWILKNSRTIIAISPFLQKQMKARFGNKVDFIPLGVDLQVFQPLPRAVKDRVRVITAGNLQPHTRPGLFLRLAARFPKADFVWYGQGEIAAATEEARRMGLSNVRFPGALPPRALAKEMAKSDIFVLTSMGEGVPKVTQEAAAVGLPLLAFGFYEPPTLTDNWNGLCAWSDAQFESSLERLLEDAQLRREMSRRSIEMSRGWSWEDLAPRWEQAIVERVLARPQRSQAVESPDDANHVPSDG